MASDVNGLLDAAPVPLQVSVSCLDVTHGHRVPNGKFRSKVGLILGQDYKEKHKLKTNLKLTVLNNTKLRHF